MATNETRETVRLTKTRVAEIVPGLTVLRIFDSVVPGFHVRVTPKGTKSYAVTFQRKNGVKVHITLGPAKVLSAEDAREQARKLRELHDSGEDARAHMDDKRNAKTMKALVQLWEEDYRPKLKPSSQRSYDSLIKCIILPAFGSRLVKDLDRPSIKALWRKESKAHAIGANRMITVLSRLMNIAGDEGWRPIGDNPCQRFPKSKEKPCPRVFTAAELARLESSTAGLEASGKLDQIAADLIRFLALSGLRSGEASNLKWTNIDLGHNTMTIVDHKTESTMGPKVLPLNSPLRAIIKRRAGAVLGKLVFPGLVQDAPIKGLRKMWLRVLAVKGCELGEATPHDLRRTFMSVSVELGWPIAMGNTLLGHSLGKITDTYTKLSMDGILATVSEDTALWIASALRGEAPKHGVKITAGPEAKAMA